MNAEPSAEAASARACPFCQAPLGDLPTAGCQDCGAVYHADCLAAAGRCAVPGCSREDAAPAPSGTSRVPSGGPAGQPPCLPPSHDAAGAPSAPQGPPPPHGAAAAAPGAWSPPDWNQRLAPGSQPLRSSASTPAGQRWKESSQLLWEDVPGSLRWVGGIVVALVLLATVAAVVGNADTAQPDVADSGTGDSFDDLDSDTADAVADDVFDDAVDVDRSPGADNVAYGSLSVDDRQVCETFNRRVRVADEVAEFIEIVLYVYRYSDSGGTLEIAASEVLDEFRRAANGYDSGDAFVTAGKYLLYVCYDGG